MTTETDAALVSTSGTEVFMGLGPAPIQFKRPSAEEIKWLCPVWLACGGKEEFDVFPSDWTGEGGYQALVQHLQDAEKRELLVVSPIDQVQPNEGVHVMLFPGTARTLEEETEARKRRSVSRQVTVGGKGVDLRNRANFDLFGADMEDVENVTHSYLHQLRSDPTKGQRRRLICELHRVMLLRGRELSRRLYGSLCLRLGMPLPPDFWKLSRTEVGNGKWVTCVCDRENSKPKPSPPYPH